VAAGRPFVVLKLGLTLDGRVAIPGARWITGEQSRHRVHELRAQVDAVAVGMGTVRADHPQLTARGVDAVKQPRRLVFGRGPTPLGVRLELRSGALADELAALAEEGVQVLLLEGGPKLAESFLREDLVDKVLLFVAPTIASSGPAFTPQLLEPMQLRRFTSERVGDDLLLSGYVHEP
jgi:diaminohydroxyphosphoribosylaminopyrimidine deaminase/5-amino-6-(5-phosphoribosylamino)uracil reductase